MARRFDLSAPPVQRIADAEPTVCRLDELSCLDRWWKRASMSRLIVPSDDAGRGAAQKSRLRPMHPRWLEATTPKRLKRGHMAQSLNEDTARSQTPCSYEVQLLDVHWGRLMAENHIPRARLEAARCTPMAESHSPRGRLKAAKKGLHRLCILRLTACVASAASSSQGSVLAGVPPARLAFAS